MPTLLLKVNPCKRPLGFVLPYWGPKAGAPGKAAFWQEDYFELKSNQNPVDSGKTLYLPSTA